MNYKRAFLIGIVLFIISIIINGYYGRFLGITFTTALPTGMPDQIWFVVNATAVLLGIVGTFWYFLPSKITPGFARGLQLGAFLSVIGMILDLVVVGFQTGGVDVVLGYLAQFYFWLAFALIIFVSGIVGFIKAKLLEYEI